MCWWEHRKDYLTTFSLVRSRKVFRKGDLNLGLKTKESIRSKKWEERGQYYRTRKRYISIFRGKKKCI